MTDTKTAPKITTRKSAHYSAVARRYEVLADGKSIGWTIGWEDGTWSVTFRHFDGNTGIGFDQDSRKDAIAEICIKSIRFYGYGVPA